MKIIRYSYLLNNERSPEHAVNGCELHKTIRAAKKAREDDCYDGLYRKGPIVKVTLETLAK